MSEAIILPENLQQNLIELAQAKGVTINAVIEEALNLYLMTQKTTKPLPKSIGMGKSEITDLSERVVTNQFLDLENEPFVGMWADNLKMQDSTAWVKSIRQ